MFNLKSGESVTNRENSHLHEGVLNLLPEALGKIESKNRNFLVEEVNFGKRIGITSRVLTSKRDEIVYAQRVGRKGLSRFVKNREPEASSTLVVILKKVSDGYILITGFIGTLAEVEPWDKKATQKSREFWKRNALIWGSEKIISGTETCEVPEEFR